MRSMNSVQVHCSQWKSQMLQLKKKKKVKEQLSAQSEQALSVSGVRKFIWHIAIFKYEDFWCKIYY